MSAEKETLRRVQDGLFHLQKGLAPFVEARMKAAYGAAWLQYVSRARGAAESGALDAYALLKTMIDRWRDVFNSAFPDEARYKARGFVTFVLEARNAIAHHGSQMPSPDALRYLDAMHELLKLMKAPANEAAELARFYEAKRRTGLSLELKMSATARRDTVRMPEDVSNSDELPEGSRWCSTRTGRAKFAVRGSVATGAEIWPGKTSYPIKFSRQFLSRVLDRFQLGEFAVGGKFDDPGHGSLGEFIQQELRIKTNPAVYLAALLIDEQYAESTKRDYIRFRPKSDWPASKAADPSNDIAKNNQ